MQYQSYVMVVVYIVEEFPLYHVYHVLFTDLSHAREFTEVIKALAETAGKKASFTIYTLSPVE